MVNILSVRAAYQHIEPNCTFHRSLGYTARNAIWFPFYLITAIAGGGFWLAYVAALLPLAYLMLWYRLVCEYFEGNAK